MPAHSLLNRNDSTTANSMEIPKTYDPGATEDKWYGQWQQKGFFRSVPDDRTPYTIVIPPPNITGLLHMGHMLNNTIQDIIIRQERMKNKNALWVPGTDHASIATEAKVVALLAEQGLKKEDVGREKFLEHAWEWKEKYGNIILEQLKKLGASCDWDRLTFTLDDNYYKSVIKVFNDLYDKGMIYKGTRMVNWDPSAKTAISDEEVSFKETTSVLYYVRYRFADGNGYVTVATTRPETIMGDVALAIHPEDRRYTHWLDRKVIVPFTGREIPFVTDESIDREFGTGILKVTPAHDKADFEIGRKYGLEIIDVFNEDGTVSNAAGAFEGLDRFDARKKAATRLEEEDLLEKKENITNNISISERTGAVVEPRLSEQWFCRMSSLAGPAMEAVMSDDVEFYPSKYKNVFRHWMENIHDWCISRQLWWGHRIPVWYLTGTNEFFVAVNEEEALQKAKVHTGNDALELSALRQDEDVLDTWFSSWIWPMAVFNGILEPDNKEISYYYPTDTLVTGPDIIFFWVARMIMAGIEYTGKEPFNEVYFTGLVRDAKGRKMSKSLGNSPDVLELMERLGADAVRFGVMVSSPAGNDILFDEKLCEQGRNFANKIWNATRLIMSWNSPDVIKHKSSRFNQKPVEWFENRLNQALHQIDDLFEEYRLSEALTSIYKLIWDDFCATYLEMVKPDPSIGLDQITFEKTVDFFEKLIRLLHPFMPFITEEIYQIIRTRGERDFCIVASYPEPAKADVEVIKKSERIIAAITGVRAIRNENGISPKQALTLFIKSDNVMLYRQWEPIITKMANISHVDFVKESVPNAKSFTVKTDEFYVPVSIRVDVAGEIARLEKELEYSRGFLKAVMAKLANERFLQNARPEILEMEQQKKADAEARISNLENSLQELQNNN